MLTKEDFGSLFQQNEILMSGGNRTQFAIELIDDEGVVIRPTSSKTKAAHRLSYLKVSATVEAFRRIDPSRIVPTFQESLKGRIVPMDHTNETYLYGLAREFLKRSGHFDAQDDVLPEEIAPGIAVTLSEGAKKTIVVNRYERDAAAKPICLEAHGDSCLVCGFNFEKTYGSFGKGFIHVHHLTPLHTIGKQYNLDPVQDLRPVCANCHAMLHHSKGEALTISELARKLTK